MVWVGVSPGPDIGLREEALRRGAPSPYAFAVGRIVALTRARLLGKFEFTYLGRYEVLKRIGAGSFGIGC